MSTLERLAPAAPLAKPSGHADDAAPAAWDLVSLRDTAARVVRARHSGSEGEDLVQEAWTRIAVALRDRPVTDPHAYAAGIAANLVRSWDRRDQRHRRRAPLMWVLPTVDPPDAKVVRDEEASALALALRRVPAPARDVLVAHIVHGLDTATIARESGTSAGAVAACLARARAVLRVEYLIAFRHLPTPADHCRRVCYAVSANDTRREARLHAAEHLQRCEACRALTETIRERRRPAMAAAVALRLSHWGARLAQVDWRQTGPNVGMASGLVSMGVVSALALGGVIGPPSAPARPAAIAVAAVAAPAPAASPALPTVPASPLAPERWPSVASRGAPTRPGAAPRAGAAGVTGPSPAGAPGVPIVPTPDVATPSVPDTTIPAPTLPGLDVALPLPVVARAVRGIP